MKLILKNFKCWQDKTIELGESGITLLNGPSGIGKSSIFCAILFVLTGDGKNIVANGTSSLKAELITDDYHIIRTRRPNRLIFKTSSKEYEDDEAQLQINKIFSALFPTTSYINQNDTESFLKMSSADKLTFLETIAFQNIDISAKKDKIKGITKDRNNKLIAAASRMESLGELLQTMKEVKMPNFPIKCKPDEEDKIIEKYQRLEKTRQQKLQETINLITNLEYQLTSITNMEEKIVMLQAEKDTLTTNITTIQMDLSRLEYNQDTYEMLTTQLSKFDKMENALKKLKDINQTDDKLQFRKKELTEKLGNISSESLWQEGTESDTVEALESLNSYLTDVKKYTEYTSSLESLLSRKKKLNVSVDINDLQQEIEELQQKVDAYNLSKVLFSCPDCNCKLSIINKTIKKYTGDIITIDPTPELQTKTRMYEEARSSLEKLNTIDVKITDLQGQIQEINDTYESIQTEDEILENIREYKTYLEKNRRLEKGIEIEKSTTIRLLQEVNRDIEKIGVERNRFITESDGYNMTAHEDCRTSIADIRSMKKTFESQTGMLHSFQSRLVDIQSQIEGYNEKIIMKDKIGLELKEQTSQKTGIEEDIKKVEIANQKINNYISNKKEYLNWIAIKEKYDAAKLDETIATEELDAINILREKFLLSESIYLNNFILSLNTHLQSYIDTFFIDDPMVVTIKPFKTTKKDVQPQINLEIGYKGMDCDISTLSGGERDRLNLAFTLSFSELMNTPVLLLDECISSLDYGNFNNVLSSLKENYKGKLIVLISHQANEGLFDKIIELK